MLRRVGTLLGMAGRSPREAARVDEVHCTLIVVEGLVGDMMVRCRGVFGCSMSVC